MLPDPPEDKDRDRRALLIAAAVSLALHAGAILGFGRIAHGGSPPPLDVMNVQLVSDAASASESSAPPKQFTELPADRADKAPVKPELLSNVTSRARDQVPGGDSDHPKAHEAGPPTVKLEPRGASAPSTSPPQAPQAGTATGNSTAANSAKTPGQEPNSPTGATASPTSARARNASDSSPHPGLIGNSDIQQPDLGDYGGNAAPTGDISLNTMAWDYAPWLERYKRRLLERWLAPPAYYLGLLPDGGYAIMQVEISPSGKMLHCDLLGQQGAQTLVEAADNAVRYLSPIDPLPAGFPEPTLILRIRMIYPRVTHHR